MSEQEDNEPEWIKEIMERESKFLGYVNGKIGTVPVKNAYFGTDFFPYIDILIELEKKEKADE